MSKELINHRKFKRLTLLLLFFWVTLIACRLTSSTEVTPEPKVVKERTPTIQPAGDELIASLESLGFGKYLETPEFNPQHIHESGWDIYRYSPDELQCVLGGKYFIMTRKGSLADKTVFWMDGGGSCWPGRDDCVKRAQFIDSIVETGLASVDEDNPVRDWNFVYVPYCDGSIHLGDNFADYDGDGAIDHRHLGLKMTSAAVRLMAENFPKTQEILVAGGGGTLGATPIIRMQYPKADIKVFNISGLSLIKPGERDTYELIMETWNTAHLIPDECERCKDQFTYLYSWLLDRDPDLRVGIFSSYYDKTLGTTWQITPEEIRSLIIQTTDDIREDHPETFKRFMIDGDSHCISDFSRSVQGISIWDWLGYLVNDDPRWGDIQE